MPGVGTAGASQKAVMIRERNRPFTELKWVLLLWNAPLITDKSGCRSVQPTELCPRPPFDFLIIDHQNQHWESWRWRSGNFEMMGMDTAAFHYIQNKDHVSLGLHKPAQTSRRVMLAQQCHLKNCLLAPVLLEVYVVSVVTEIVLMKVSTVWALWV